MSWLLVFIPVTIGQEPLAPERQLLGALNGDQRGAEELQDLGLSIAIGSSIQVALFAALVLVLASLLVGPGPMDLALPVTSSRVCCCLY